MCGGDVASRRAGRHQGRCVGGWWQWFEGLWRSPERLWHWFEGLWRSSEGIGPSVGGILAGNRRIWRGPAPPGSCGAGPQKNRRCPRGSGGCQAKQKRCLVLYVEAAVGNGFGGRAANQLASEGEGARHVGGPGGGRWRVGCHHHVAAGDVVCGPTGHDVASG